MMTGNQHDNQPKPRKEDAATPTGEWTEGMVFAYWESEDFKGLADAHKAALTDEREKVENLHKILGQKRTTIKELREQLAAESGNTKQLVDALKNIRVGAPDIVKQQIKDALEKVGK